jgi:hypothetical protein
LVPRQVPRPRYRYAIDGEYVYVRGGPYDSDDVLQGRFADIVDLDTIGELADELDGISSEWAAIDTGLQEYDDDFEFESDSRGQPRERLNKRFADLEKLATVDVGDASSQLLQQMLFGSYIAALEAYLAETITFWVNNEESVLKNFVRTNPDFRNERVSVADLFEKVASISHDVEKYLGDQIWHRLDRIKPMYEKALGIKFPEIGVLMKAILIRHDIVHRAGRTRDGQIYALTSEDVDNLEDEIERAVRLIEAELEAKFKPEY